MQSPVPGTANVIWLDAVAKASGSPITAGTVNLYVVADGGANDGKWFKHGDQTWNAAETVCVAMTHKADGHWYASVHADCWTDGQKYVLYVKESGDLHIPYTENVRCAYALFVSASGYVRSLLSGLLNTALTESGVGWLAAAAIKFLNVETPLLDCSAAMRGTDGAYTGTPPTADAIGTNAAGKVLVTPAQKLVTDASGHVTLANGAHGGAAASVTLAAPLALEASLTALRSAVGRWKRMKNPVYSATGEITSCELHIYYSQANFDTDTADEQWNYVATVVNGQVTAYSFEQQ